MSDLDKLALINNECAIKTKIILDDGTVLTESDYIENWDYEDFRYVPNQGFIGQFVERVVNGKLKNVDDSFTLENKVIDLQLAIVRNDGTETWYSLGHFIVNSPTDDNVKDSTSFKAVDVTKYFETPYVDKTSYPTTAGALAYNVCKQAKTELGNFQATLTTDTTIDENKQYFTYDSENDVYNLIIEPLVGNISTYYEINECFTNSDFVILDNQFVNNETCRVIMKAIGMLAYSWVRIGWDDKCYLDFEVNKTILSENIITNDNYYDLNTKNEYFGEVNEVIIGMKDVDGENITLVDEESATEENFEITLWDNPLTYTQELREQAIIKANKLFGLKYKPVEMTTTGNPWLIGNELLEIIDMEGNSIFTYPFDRTISYSGHIKTKIKSQAISKTDTKYAYEGALNNLSKTLKNTQIIVNKNEQQIQSLVTETENLSDTVVELGTTMTQNKEEFEFSISALTDVVNTNNENLQGAVDDINGTLENGVEKVKNSLVSIDINGIHVSTNLSKIESIMTNNKFEVKDGATELVFIGYDETLGRSEARMDNLTVSNYFTAGYHRQEKFEPSGEKRTGWFYVGGDI